MINVSHACTRKNTQDIVWLSVHANAAERTAEDALHGVLCRSPSPPYNIRRLGEIVVPNVLGTTHIPPKRVTSVSHISCILSSLMSWLMNLLHINTRLILYYYYTLMQSNCYCAVQMVCQSTCSTLIYLIFKSIKTIIYTPISIIPNVWNFVMVRQIRWRVLNKPPLQ